MAGATRRTATILLLFFLTGSNRAAPQQVSSWARPQATLRLGQSAPEKPIVGKFAAETDGSVSLKVGDTIRVIPAWTIRTVDVAYEFDNHGAIGAPLGAIAGAVLGGLLAKINKVASEGGPLGYAAAGAVVGITIGWAVTSPRTRARWLPVPWSPPEKPE